MVPQFLTQKTDMQVVGGLLSPAHQSAVKNTLRRNAFQAIPILHRLAMCELAVRGSSWLAVSRWEATRRSPLDYPSVLKNTQKVSSCAVHASRFLPC